MDNLQGLDNKSIIANINSHYLTYAKVKFTKEEIDAKNQWADYWYNTNGQNCIPGDTQNKLPKVLLQWNSGNILYQNNPIPIETFETWKELGLFGYGICNVAGPIWRGESKGECMNTIDYDNLLAKQEICKRLGITEDELHQRYLVEQHKDDPGSGHIYVKSKIPFPKKPSNKTSKDPELIRKLENNEIPSLEVKPEGLVFCCNSTHKDGKQYEIMGRRDATRDDDFYLIIDTVCKKYAPLQYLEASGKAIQQPIEELFKEDHFVGPNQNRSLDLLRICGSIIKRNKKIFSKERLYEMANVLHKEHHSPYPQQKVDAIFEQAWNKIEDEEKEDVRLDEYINKIIEESKDSNSKEDNKSQNHEEHTPQPEPEIKEKVTEDVELEAQIPDKDYGEYVVNTAKRTVRQEDALIRLIFYTGLSKDSSDPLNLAIMAPTSEGKTYPVVEVMNLFPNKDVWSIGAMSTKTLVRMNGILVDRNNNPIGPIVKKIRKAIAVLGNGKADKIKKVELEEKLEMYLEGSKSYIHLDGKIIVFLEPPDTEVWTILKPILSHDKKEIEYPYVDTYEGITTKNIVVSGWPACIVCSAKDESRWPQWER